MSSNSYLVMGTCHQAGTVDDMKTFEIEKEARFSRSAYVQAHNDLYNSGHRDILIETIKMKSPFSQKFTIVVPPILYL